MNIKSRSANYRSPLYKKSSSPCFIVFPDAYSQEVNWAAALTAWRPGVTLVTEQRPGTGVTNVPRPFWSGPTPPPGPTSPLRVDCIALPGRGLSLGANKSHFTTYTQYGLKGTLFIFWLG